MNTLSEDAERSSRRIHHDLVNYDNRKDHREEEELPQNGFEPEESYQEEIVDDRENPYASDPSEDDND